VQPTPRSLILDLLSTLRRGSMPVRALLEAGALFDLAEGSLRVALARLLASGQVESDQRGRYRLGPAAVALNQQVAAWRLGTPRVRTWREGEWVAALVSAVARGDRPAAARRRRALEYLGLRELQRGLFVRPDNLQGGASGARERLRALGFPTEDPVFALSDLDLELEARARKLWGAARLEAGYRASRDRLAKSARRIPRLGREAAMVESFTVGGGVLRQLARDPLLPEPIARSAEREALALAMRDYDRLGRACWADWRRRFEIAGDSHGAAPADLRIAEYPTPTLAGEAA
jgi:phenylacetic acid degradation operon negative regulatory protein